MPDPNRRLAQGQPPITEGSMAALLPPSPLAASLPLSFISRSCSSLIRLGLPQLSPAGSSSLRVVSALSCASSLTLQGGRVRVGTRVWRLQAS